MEDRTPLWYNNQRQVGAGCSPTKNQVVSESHPQKVADKILAGRWGAAREDEVALRVHGVFPLPMGMEREDRCE